MTVTQAVDLPALWAQVQAGAGPRVAYLHGASGSGKSHLLRQVGDGDHRRVHLNAPDLTGTLIGALQARLTGRDPDVLAFLRAARPDLPWPMTAQPPTGDAAAGPRALADTLSLLAQEQGGALLTVDHLDRAAPEDLDLLRACWRAAAQGRAPLLLLIAGQTEVPEFLQDARRIAVLNPGSDVQAHPMPPLDDAALRHLLRGTLGAVDANLAPWLLARADGLPLHAAALIGHLRAGGFLRPVGGAWTFTPPPRADLPGTLDALLRARWHAAQTEEAMCDVLNLLALSAAPLTLGDLGVLTGLDRAALDRTLDTLHGAALIHTEAREGDLHAALTHPGFAAVGRQTLTPAEDRDLRARLARHHRDPHERARHARLADLPGADDLTEQAMAVARATGAHSLLAEHAAAALTRTDDPGRRARLQVELGRAQLAQGLNRQAARTLADLPDPDDAAREAHLEALLRLGEYRAGLDLLAAMPTPLSAPLAVLHARFMSDAGDLDAAAPLLDALLTLPGADPVQVRFARAHHALLRRDPHALHAEAQAALPLVTTDAQRADLLNYLALAHTWFTQYDDADRTYRECLDVQRRSGQEARMQTVYANLGNLHLAHARLRDAQDAYATALSLARTGSTTLIEMNARGMLGVSMVMAGQEAGLDHMLAWQAYYREHLPATAPFLTAHTAAALTLFGRDDEARTLIDLYPPDTYRPFGLAHLILAQLHLTWGDLDRARTVLDDAPDYAGDPLGEIERLSYRALLLALEGDLNGAETLLREALAHPGAPSYPATLAMLHWALLGVRHRQHAPQDELRALGAQVHAFLTTSGGLGHLRLLDRLFPEDRAQRHEYLEPAAPHTRPAFLRTLGHFDLEEHGEVRPWKARKVRELLALLLCAHVSDRGPTVPRETLQDALWPDLPAPQAEGNFRKTLARLRDALGTAAHIDRAGTGYALSGLRSDLTLYLKALHDHDLSAACAWYEGPFLPGVDLPDVDDLRAALHARWRAAALQLVQEEPTPQATRLLTQLLRDDPFDPDALSLLPTYPADPDGSLRRLCETLRAQHLRELGEVPPEIERALHLHA
ncbi:AAA family ATPase [Deinococcus sedimenti]|uniref:Orc1-like AAA ATPase domain-containing protein n=1 Tax=Deinococcus sedimenti TaxID=1867090 RepID=A0ABQ2S252_9DEIO|nr:AAA family ATPase [Deinococcus sedimenti]GGR90618.1 hypothetical protein GCM10008960_17090 [Deinococcus sedimenti]